MDYDCHGDHDFRPRHNQNMYVGEVCKKCGESLDAEDLFGKLPFVINGNMDEAVVDLANGDN